MISQLFALQKGLNILIDKSVRYNISSYPRPIISDHYIKDGFKQASYLNILSQIVHRSIEDRNNN